MLSLLIELLLVVFSAQGLPLVHHLTIAHDTTMRLGQLMVDRKSVRMHIYPSYFQSTDLAWRHEMQISRWPYVSFTWSSILLYTRAQRRPVIFPAVPLPRRAGLNCKQLVESVIAVVFSSNWVLHFRVHYQPSPLALALSSILYCTVAICKNNFVWSALRERS